MLCRLCIPQEYWLQRLPMAVDIDLASNRKRRLVYRPALYEYCYRDIKQDACPTDFVLQLVVLRHHVDMSSLSTVSVKLLRYLLVF